MTRVLEALSRIDVIADIDEQFARAMARLVGGAQTEVLLGAALASARTRDGHVCADLTRIAGAPICDALGRPVGELRWPRLDAWMAALGDSELVGDGVEVRPLVLDAARGRLYLRRYWQYEQRLATQLRARAAATDDGIDLARLREGMERLFPGAGASDPGAGGQRRAALTAVLRRFAVISGGPGTGKTSTVVKLLALLLEQAAAAGRPRPVMTLVAPTGKAAARLVESIRGAKAKLPLSDAIKRDIVEEASTIHRRLGPIPGRTTRFRHDADNPLATDLVLVDEGSMVDLALMVRLVEAVPPRARLILLGDRDQLASVDAGAVLGDICNAEDTRGFSAPFAARIAEVTGEAPPRGASAPAGPGIWDCIVHLNRSYRYGEHSGIGVLARAINAGDAGSVRRILLSGDFPDVVLRPPPAAGDLGDELRSLLVEGYRPYLTAARLEDKFEAFNRFRVLCAHRRGALGVEQTNGLAERALEGPRVRLIERSGALSLYAGRPVLITANDYNVRLFNGDIGLLVEDEASAGAGVRAAFVAPDRTVRRLAPSRLPPHETAFAMTVHKSQGSEFDEVVVLLPAAVSKILSRELLYTAVTRAKSKVVLFGDAEVVAQAVARRVQRASGLSEALWGPRQGGSTRAHPTGLTERKTEYQ
jgi:exodeoxyribonuclease V alpha subunit